MHLCTLNTPESAINLCCTFESLHILRADALTGFGPGDGCARADMAIHGDYNAVLTLHKNSPDSTADFPDGHSQLPAVAAQQATQPGRAVMPRNRGGINLCQACYSCKCFCSLISVIKHSRAQKRYVF